MRRSLFVGSLAVCLAAALSSSTLLAADNWLGTWKLNAARTTYSPGPPPQSMTAKFVAAGDTITLTTDGVSATGEATHSSYSSKFDGKDVPWTGSPDADTAAPKRINPTTYENAAKKAGKVTVVSKIVVSPNGKVMKVTQTGTNGKGEQVNNLLVFDKQ